MPDEFDHTPRIPKPTKEQLTAWALEAEWEKIDEALPIIANEQEYVDWANEMLNHSDEDIRDLAASIFQASKIELTADTVETLRKIMLNDENPYARFRAAFALFEHGDRSQLMKDTVKLARKDSDKQIVMIAESIFTRLGRENGDSPTQII